MESQSEMTKPLIILGAGGHAKVVLSVALELGIDVKCLTDNDKKKHGKKVLGIEVLGDDRILRAFGPDKFELAMGLGVGSDNTQLTQQLLRRFKVFTKLFSHGYKFPPLIHPNAGVAQGCIIGNGVQVFSGSVVQPNCKIGDLTILNTKASIDHDSVIGKACHIAPGVTCGGSVDVGSNTHIGMGATILPNIKIGTNSIIAAASLVNKSVKIGGKVCGTPAKVMME